MPEKSQFWIGILAFLLSMGRVSFAASTSDGAAGFGNTATLPVRYALVMSGDQGLCRPLLNFYNAHLTDQDNEETGLIEDRFASDLRSPGPVLVMDNSDTSNWQDRVLPSVDIYNDDSRHTVVIQDRGISDKFSTYHSILLILAYSANPTSLSDLKNISRIDPRVERWVDFSDGGSSLSAIGPPSHWFRPYLLRKYPDFVGIMTRFESGDRHVDLPLIQLGMNQRVILYRGKTFVVARQLVDTPIEKEVGNKSIVYAIDRSGVLQDLCYLEVQKTGPIGSRGGTQ